MRALERLRHVKGVRGVLYRADRGWSLARFAVQAAADTAAIRRYNGSRPKVTAVVVGRNDDYMSDFAHRLRATIRWNLEYLASEVIFVEWNPPAERDLLSTDLVQNFANLRAYVVSREIHQELSVTPHIPVMEYHAKNVGIRRAATDWIVVTNADAAFAPDAARKILETPLADDVVWVTQRIDIEWPEGRTSDMRFTDCLRQRRVIPFHELGTGEFAFASRKLWETAKGYDESLVRHRIGVDKRGVAQMISRGGRSRKAGLVFHMTHPNSCTEVEGKHQGEWATYDDVPYENGPNWGLADREEVKITDRVWLLK